MEKVSFIYRFTRFLMWLSCALFCCTFAVLASEWLVHGVASWPMIAAMLAYAWLCWHCWRFSAPPKTRYITIPDFEDSRGNKFVGCRIAVPDDWTDEEAFDSVFVSIPPPAPFDSHADSA